MFEHANENIDDLNKKFLNYLHYDELFYASEDELQDLIVYYIDKPHLEKKLIDFALKCYPNSSFFLTQKGIYYYNLFDLEKAESFFKKAYIADTDNFQAISYLFLTGARNNQKNKAIYYFNLLKDTLKDDKDALFIAAEEIYFDVIGNEKSALLTFLLTDKNSDIERFIINKAYELYTFLVENDNDDVYLVYYKIASCLSLLKDDEKSKFYLRKSIEINPYFSEAWIAQAALNIKEGNFSEALKNIEYSHSADFSTELPKYTLANLLFLAERYDDSLYLLNDLKNNPEVDLWEITFLEAKIYQSLNKFSLALKLLKKCLLIDAKRIEPLYNIVSIYLEEGKLKKAYKYLEKIQSVDKDNDEFYYLLADYYLRKGDLLLGIRYVNKALRKNPFEVDYALLKSELIEAKINVKESINYLCNYLTNIEQHALIYYKLAGLYVNKKNVNKAYKYLRIAINKDSDYINDFLESYPDALKYDELKSLINLSNK